MADELTVDAHVIPHGVDRDRFRPIPTRAAREAVGWDDDAATVLFPYAPDRTVKNYPRAERVVDRARERLDEQVTLRTLGDAPYERMPLYVNAADAVLLTSDSEGSPNSVKEAMACNVPVVATDVGDVRSLLADVEPSHVCRSDDELVAGLVDVLRRGEPSNGRRVDRIGRDRMAERVLDVYGSVL
jgi:glycosyltransferase involved in cell wall biosynthesis